MTVSCPGAIICDVSFLGEEFGVVWLLFHRYRLLCYYIIISSPLLSGQQLFFQPPVLLPQTLDLPPYRLFQLLLCLQETGVFQVLVLFQTLHLMYNEQALTVS